MTQYRCANWHHFEAGSSLPSCCPSCPGGRPCDARTYEAGHFTERTGRWVTDGQPQEFKTKVRRRA